MDATMVLFIYGIALIVSWLFAGGCRRIAEWLLDLLDWWD